MARQSLPQRLGLETYRPLGGGLQKSYDVCHFFDVAFGRLCSELTQVADAKLSLWYIWGDVLQNAHSCPVTG